MLLGRHAVAVVTGPHHLQLRKILRPAFSVSSVNDLVPRMAAIARRCCDKWAAEGRGKGLLHAKEFTFSVSGPLFASLLKRELKGQDMPTSCPT